MISFEKKGGKNRINNFYCNFDKNEATNKKYTSNERIFYILYAKILKNLMIKD